MSTKRNTEAQREFTVAFLARESQVSIDEVAQLYEKERERLAVGARNTGFLAIIALRNVRETLRMRSHATSSIP
jgi:hypothetical protein